MSAQLDQALLRAPDEIVFGVGAISTLPSVVAARGEHVLVCADPNVRRQPQVARALDDLARAARSCRVFDDVEPDLPKAVIARATAFARRGTVTVVVGIGGGSSIDLAKLVALGLTYDEPLETFYGENRVAGPVLPLVAVPTTAGTGSEVTPVAVVSDPDLRLKVGVSSPRLIPDVAVCDPALTVSCPPHVTAHAGIDALIHAAEAFVAPVREVPYGTYPGDVFRGSGLFTDTFALEAIGRVGGALERAVADGGDLAARTDMALGSLCAGLAFGTAGTAAIHALQYPVGALTHTPHGLGVGLLAPYVLDFVRHGCEPDLARVGRALGVAEDDTPVETAARAAVDEIRRLAAAVGIPRTLREIGVDQAALPSIATDAASIARLLRNSPVGLGVADLEVILERAWHG